MFPAIALPESVLHAQFRLKATGLPPRAKRRGIVRLTDLKFVERPDMPARFSAMLDASIQAHAGVAFRVLDERTRAAQLDNGNWPRRDLLHELRFEIENTTDAALSFNEIVTLAGYAVEADAPVSAPPPLVPQPLELEAQTVGCVPLLARFEQLAVASGGGGGEPLVLPDTTSVNEYYVDANRDIATTPDGSFFAPFPTVQEALDAFISNAPADNKYRGVIHVAHGVYDQAHTLAVPADATEFALTLEGIGGRATRLGALQFTLSPCPQIRLEAQGLGFYTAPQWEAQSISADVLPHVATTALKIVDAPGAGTTSIALRDVTVWADKSASYALHVTNAGDVNPSYLEIQCSGETQITCDKYTTNAAHRVVAARLERGNLLGDGVQMGSIAAPCIEALGRALVNLSGGGMQAFPIYSGFDAPIAGNWNCIEAAAQAIVLLRNALMIPFGDGHVVQHVGSYDGVGGLVMVSEITLATSGAGGVAAPAGAVVLSGALNNAAGAPLPVQVPVPQLRVRLQHASQIAAEQDASQWGGAAPATVKEALAALRQLVTTSSTDVEWANVQNKPETFAPSTHDHDDLYYQKGETYTKDETASALDNALAAKRTLSSEVGRRKGGWYRPCKGYQAGSIQVPNNTLILVPFDIISLDTIDRLAVRVSAAGGAGSLWRFVIYSGTGDGWPDALLQNFGTVSLATTAERELTIDWAPTAVGRYWLGGVVTVVGTTPTFTGMRGYDRQVPALTSMAAMDNEPMALTQTLADGNPPATFAGTGAILAIAPIMAYRLKP